MNGWVNGHFRRYSSNHCHFFLLKTTSWDIRFKPLFWIVGLLFRGQDIPLSRVISQLLNWPRLTLWMKLFLFSIILNSPSFYKPISEKNFSGNFQSVYLLASRFPLDSRVTMPFLKSPHASWWAPWVLAWKYLNSHPSGPVFLFALHISGLHSLKYSKAIPHLPRPSISPWSHLPNCPSKVSCHLADTDVMSVSRSHRFPPEKL